MKVSINREECIEYRACKSACSKIFVVESGEKKSIVEKYQTKESAEVEACKDLSGCMQQVYNGCQVEVIKVE